MSHRWLHLGAPLAVRARKASPLYSLCSHCSRVLTGVSHPHRRICITWRWFHGGERANIGQNLANTRNWKDAKQVYLQYKHDFEVRNYRFLFSHLVKTCSNAMLKRLAQDSDFVQCVRDAVEAVTSKAHREQDMVPVHVWAGLLQHLDNATGRKSHRFPEIKRLLDLEPNYRAQLHLLTPRYLSGLARSFKQASRADFNTYQRFWDSMAGVVMGKYPESKIQQWEPEDMVTMLSVFVDSPPHLAAAEFCLGKIAPLVSGDTHSAQRLKLLSDGSSLLSLFTSLEKLHLDDVSNKNGLVTSRQMVQESVIAGLSNFTGRQLAIIGDTISKPSQEVSSSEQEVAKHLADECIHRIERSAMGINELLTVADCVARSGVLAPKFFFVASQVFREHLPNSQTTRRKYPTSQGAATIIQLYTIAGEPAPNLLVEASKYLKVGAGDDNTLRKRGSLNGSVLELKTVINTITALANQGIPANQFLELASVRLVGALKGSAQRYLNHLPQDTRARIQPILEKPVGVEYEWNISSNDIGLTRLWFPPSFVRTVLSPREVTQVLWAYSVSEFWCNYGLFQHGLRLLSILYTLYGKASPENDSEMEVPGSFLFSESTFDQLWEVVQSVELLSPWPELSSSWISPELRSELARRVVPNTCPLEEDNLESLSPSHSGEQKHVSGQNIWQSLSRLLLSPVSSLSSLLKEDSQNYSSPEMEFSYSPASSDSAQSLGVNSGSGMLNSVVNKYFQPLHFHKTDAAGNFEDSLGTLSTIQYHQKQTALLLQDFTEELTKRHRDMVILEPELECAAFPLSRVDVVWQESRVALLVFGCEHLAPTSSVATRPYVLARGMRCGQASVSLTSWNTDQLCASLRPWHVRRLDTRFLRPQHEHSVRLLERNGWTVPVVYTFEWERAKGEHRITDFLKDRLPRRLYISSSE
eukprot:gb/GECG01009602.1/.p1 GENE.gb/GECG01009602.1/~~gb/GECG01009602.1/.p1  ORF type:complete len:925 (+),score=68.43 gb/GECG01009602.1/:1-2775(+)